MINTNNVMLKEQLELYIAYKEQVKKLEEQIQVDGERVADRIALIQEADGKRHRGDYTGPKRYVNIDGEWDWYHCGDDANYAECFRIEGKWCYWYGESKSYDDCTIYEAGKFEANRLCMTDDELDAWAKERIEEIKKGRRLTEEREKLRKERERAEKERKKEEKERKEYERLKKKFEGNN